MVEFTGIETVKFPDEPENDVSLIGVKSLIALFPTETENSVGELVTDEYGIVNAVAETATLEIVPTVIVGAANIEIVTVLEVAELHPPLVTTAL